MKKIQAIVVLFALLGISGTVQAQRLGGAVPSAQPQILKNEAARQAPKSAFPDIQMKQVPSPEAAKPQAAETEEAAAADDNVKTNAPEEVFLPKEEEEALRPTKDGSIRGRTSVRPLLPLNDDGSEQQFILMYMENFVMDSPLGGAPTCSMRFVVLTNLDQKVSQFAVKLVWPSISTTLSFIDIMPNSRTFYDYTLFGEGCYSMDKIPNIVVNRCRIKRMTSKQCAAKIKWLKDAK